KPLSSWRKASVAPIGLLPPAGSTGDKINRSFIKVNAVALFAGAGFFPRGNMRYNMVVFAGSGYTVCSGGQGHAGK
ncbi:MAG: hypothetical protein LBI67_08105, partial [Treponema sp.]|nr:hypothetical protein [Treponema sp.]